MLDSKLWTKMAITVGAALLLTLSSCAEQEAVKPSPTSYKTRPIEEDVIYFVLPDRFANAVISNDQGGLTGTPLDHGFDPRHKGFYHGGDLQGLTGKLDYLQNLVLV